MPSQHLHHRRKSDRGVPVITVIHGSNDLCPEVQAGTWLRCLGHSSVVPDEGPVEHLKNCLSIVRVCLDFSEVAHGLNGEGPGLVIPLKHLARIQCRIEAALSLLEQDDAAAERVTDWGVSQCVTCRGTILSPTIGGVPRGTCRCPRQRVSAPPRFEDHE